MVQELAKTEVRGYVIAATSEPVAIDGIVTKYISMTIENLQDLPPKEIKEIVESEIQTLIDEAYPKDFRVFDPTGYIIEKISKPSFYRGTTETDNVADITLELLKHSLRE